MSSTPFLSWELLSLIIHHLIDSLATTDPRGPFTTDLRLVSSLFNNAILHEVYLDRPVPSKLATWDHDNLHLTCSCGNSPLGSLVATRYLQGALVNLARPDPASSINVHRRYGLLTAVAQAVHELRELLPEETLSRMQIPLHVAPALERDEETDIYHRVMHFKSVTLHPIDGDPIFGDMATLLVCSAVTRLFVPGTVLKALVGTLDDGDINKLIYREDVPGLTYLSSDFWLFLTSVVVLKDPNLGKQLLPRALGYCSFPWQERRAINELFLRCLQVAVEDNELEIFQHLLSAGVDPDPNPRLLPMKRSEHILGHVIDSGRTDFLLALLEPRYGLHKTGRDYEEAIASAVYYENVESRYVMVNALLANVDGIDRSLMRQRVLRLAMHRDDYELAKKML